MIESLVYSLPLADSEVSFLSTLLSQIWLWTRVALGIGLVIFVHELGHFLAAKTFGVKCEKFYVGFDVPIRIGPIKFPRTLGKFTYGETEYGIGILPLGGYVKMLGQDDDPRKAQEEAERIRLENGGDEDVAVQLDPRSYPAKPVWQRMIIISAGVVVNVITGILFAAIAYGYGVDYAPAIIGGVTPGGPAWQTGIQPGGEVMAVGALEDDAMHYDEMSNEILTTGMKSASTPIPVKIRYEGEVVDYELSTAPHPLDKDMRMIGITNPTSTMLTPMVAKPGSVAEKAMDEKYAGATLVGYDGNKIDNDAIVPVTPFLDYLYTHPSKPIELEFEQVDKSKHLVTLPPQTSRTLGLRFAIGPITSLVQNGSAEKAGVKVGDVITAINGDKDIDAFGLPLKLVEADSPVKLSLRRGVGDAAETIEVELAAINSMQTIVPTNGVGGIVGVNRYGLAYQVKTTISSLAGDSSGKLQVGDKVKEAHLVGKEDLEKQLDNESYTALLSELEDWKFEDASDVSSFLDSIQYIPVGTQFVLFVERPSDKKIIETTLVVSDDDRFEFERGIEFLPAQRTQVAQSLGHALSLGWREGKRRLYDVVRFLGLAVKGRVKTKHVGGPIRIVQIAGMKAEQGISPQLLFLTLLSMNLAILNFLPIPALDGGHMVFLIAEAIRGKRVDEELEMRLTLAGVLALLALMAFVFLNDIINII
ncbi:site-2 protease family protein [Planctomycetes bacterium K23_9]|uniref:Zinc metalloprotease n=1 Tax=Stieleria marina TaxID=1930275 RepID=A0A517P065_9BACT|nr:Putative zinc metalloprotease [Planctomycetes bacterium K23_9]